MKYNKFVREDGKVFLDLTSDTVTPETLSKGFTAHDRNGEPIEGTHEIKLQEKTTAVSGTITPDKGYDGLSKVTVFTDIPEGYLKPEGEIVITENGYYHVANVIGASVDVPPFIPAGYFKPEGTVTISENGYHDVSGYARANVSIVNSGEAEEFWYEDENTHLWVTFTEGRKSPVLGMCVYGTATVDWGDNTTPDVITGTSITSPIYTPIHEYAKAGNYVITIIVEGTMGIVGDSGSAGLLRYSQTNNTCNQAYANTIQKIELGRGIVSIGNYAFKNCRSLKKIFIPDTIANFGTYAFDGCYSLAEVEVPNGVTVINDYAFNNCYSLENVILPSSITIIGTYSFGNCHSLADILLPNSLVEIKNYAFIGCDSLRTITIPNGTTKLNISAFNQCSGLTTAVIPNSVTSIGNSAFANCTGMGIYDFTAYTSVPILGNTTVFNKMPADCKFLVQASLVDKWKSASNWATYADKIVGV